MDIVISFLLENIKWIFSGIGVFFLSIFFIKKVSSTNKVEQNNNIVGGDIVGRDKK